MGPNAKRNFYTREEAAELAGVTPSRIGQFVKQGRLRADDIGGGRYVIFRSELERFLSLPRTSGRPKEAK